MKGRFIGIFAALLGALLAVPAGAADPSLVAAARQEGRVVWYTTLIVDQFARPVADAFERKYGIHVDFVRADPNDIALRILNEGRGGAMSADIFDGFAQVVALDRAGFVLHWLPDAAKRFPKETYSPDGKWMGSNLYVLTPGFNTDLVPKGTEPRTFADLLDPKWKGKMVWSNTISPSAAAGFVGVVLSSMGEAKGMDYLRALAKQDVASQKIAARAVLDQVIAGEYAIALQIFNYHPLISAARGAHVDWIKMQPALAALGVFSITKPAPHENAAKLLLDFVTSPDGQAMFRDADYMPIDPAVAPRDPSIRPDGETFKAIYLTPEEIDAKVPGWMKIYEELFR